MILRETCVCCVVGLWINSRRSLVVQRGVSAFLCLQSVRTLLLLRIDGQTAQLTCSNRV